MFRPHRVVPSHYAKSRGRKTKKQRSPQRAGDPRRRAAGRSTSQVKLAGARVAGVLRSGQLSDHLTITRLLPAVMDLLAADAAIPANRCVDASQTLRHAYAQLGIAAELRAADLTITDENTGQSIVVGTPEPSWEENVLDGHCIVWLPGQQHFVDATAEQYRDIARLKLGPVVGRQTSLQTTQAGLAATAHGQLPAGAHLAVKRQHLLLMYTISSDEATAVILDSPWVQQYVHEHQRIGLNLASLALDALRLHGVTDDADRIPYPRVRALLEAIGDVPSQVDDDGYWRYPLADETGAVRPLRLDEIPLPPGTPPVVPDAPLTPTPAAAQPARRPAARPRQAGPPISQAALTKGIPGPAGTVLRLARPGETDDVDQLMRLSGDGMALAGHAAAAIEQQTIAAALRRALTSGTDELLAELAIALKAGDPNQAVPGLTAVLIAEAQDDRIVAALEAFPPAPVFAQAASAGLPVAEAMLGMTAVVKIWAVAVDETRRRTGIGAGLINLCTDLYQQLDYRLIYGQFPDRPALEDYFSARGFDVLAPGEGISLAEPLGLPIGIAPQAGERTFLQWALTSRP